MHASGLRVDAYDTLGARGDAYLRDVVRNYVRPVTWLDAPADPDKGPKFVDHTVGPGATPSSCGDSAGTRELISDP